MQLPTYLPSNVTTYQMAQAYQEVTTKIPMPTPPMMMPQRPIDYQNHFHFEDKEVEGFLDTGAARTAVNRGNISAVGAPRSVAWGVHGAEFG